MSFEYHRLHRRLNLEPQIIEKVYSILSEIDVVKNSWKITGRLLPSMIERLTDSVIITSTGASNRIEGNKLTDKEVEQLYRKLNVKKLKNRDEEEVAGYIESLKLIFTNYDSFRITESYILQLHDSVLAYSNKDLHHKGKYKIGSNRVEARDTNGDVVGVIFDPTPPYLVQKEMQELIYWLAWSMENTLKHPLILIANFIFEYLAIHPFQDGNGRTSRLLTNLFFMQNGYDFTSIVSHEKIVERRKVDYYLALNKTQSSWKTDKEDISSWLLFFLEVVKEQSDNAMQILTEEKIDYLLTKSQQEVWDYILRNSNEYITRKELVENTSIPVRTIEYSIKKLLDLKKLERVGVGRGTRYRKL